MVSDCEGLVPMTELQDPIEVYRQAIESAPRVVESHSPRFERADVLPYPELTRLWVRVQISPFSTYPNLELSLLDPAGKTVATMFIIEAREPYQSLTLHLRQPPQAGEQYCLQIELSRDGEVLDTREVDFALRFKEPTDARCE
jgi:hypothetical protein